MTGEFLLRAIGDIDDDLIAEAQDIPSRRRVPVWAKITAAACVCVCTVAVLLYPGFMKCDSMAPKAANRQEVADQKDYSYTMEDSIPDTVVGTAQSGVAFIFYTDEGKHSYWQEYPAGSPAAEEVFSDYLRAAGCEITCLSVTKVTEGEKDEVIDYGGESIMVHTVGVTTVTITLDGIPEEHVLRGLSETVRRFGFGYVKHVRILAYGEEIWHGEW